MSRDAGSTPSAEHLQSCDINHFTNADCTCYVRERDMKKVHELLWKYHLSHANYPGGFPEGPAPIEKCGACEGFVQAFGVPERVNA